MIRGHPIPLALHALPRAFAGVLLCALFLWRPAGASAPPDRWGAEADADALRASLVALLGEGTRLPGSPENLALEARVAERFSAGGFEHGEMSFEAPSFVSGDTRMAAGGRDIRLLPMHPSLFRPGNFTLREFETDLVYAGHGTERDLAALDGIDLNGVLLFLEFNSGRNWERFLRFGVKGFVFAAAERYGPRESIDKVHTSEARVPRFFVEGEDAAYLRDLLAGEHRAAVRVQAQPSRWELRTLRNLWTLVPGTDPSRQSEVVLLVAPMDANSVVPDLAQGGQAGANLHLLFELLDVFRESPPARPVLLAAVNARTQNYLGDRVLAWYLLSPESEIEQIRDAYSEDLRYQRMIASHLEDLRLVPETAEADRERLIALRTRTDDSIGRQVIVKDPVVALSKRDVNEIKGSRLLVSRRQGDLRTVRRRLEQQRETPGSDRGQIDALLEENRTEMERVEAEDVEMQRRLTSAVNVLTLFNRVGIQTTLDELTDGEVEMLRGYIDTVRTRSTRASQENRADLERSIRNGRIRETMTGRRLAFALSLELAWADERVGLSSGLELGRRAWAHRWGRNAVRVASRLDGVRAGRPNRLVDTLTNVGGLPERHYVPGYTDAVHVIHRVPGRRPAFSLNSVYAGWGRAFSPEDRVDRLDMAVVAEVHAFVRAFVPALVADAHSVTTLGTPFALRWQRMWSGLIKAHKFDEFAAGVVPEIPVAGSAIVLTDPRMPEAGFVGDIIGKPFALTGDRASALFYGLVVTQLSSSVFRFDDDFIAVDHVVDAGETHRKTTTDISRAAVRVLSVIPCEAEITVYDRADSPAVGADTIHVDRYFPLSAVRNSEPRKYGISGASSGLSNKLFHEEPWGPVSFFGEPGERLQIVTRTRRLALHVTEDEPDGVGFRDGGELGPDFFRRALQDMRRLNRYRYRRFRGVTDELVDVFLARGEASEAEAEVAAGEYRHLDFLRAQHDGLGAQSKAYGQIASITNDMLKAVVFFMALLLPFCFFVQKLLFKTTRIERQMGLFALLFIACYLVFRFIHPAFAVARAPEAMFIAFVMGGLGLFVIAILHGRFEGEMQLLFSSMTGYDAAGVGYSMVSQQAMLIGVNNMKRRRMRTLLTTATIVLVTFTMLAFTSVSRRMSPTLIPRTGAAPYTGLMYYWPGGRRMDPATHRIVNEMIDGDERRVTRWWMMPPTRMGDTAGFRVDLLGGGPFAHIDGVLGLEPAEQGFLGALPITSGRYFSSADAGEVMISADLAAFLGLDAVDVGQADLVFQGERLRLVGLLDDERLRRLEDINGFPILPIEQLLRPPGESVDIDVTSGDAADESGIFFVSTVRLLVLPSETARGMGAGPYSVSVRFPDEAPIWPVVDRILTGTSARFFVSSRVPFSLGGEASREQDPGTYYVGAGYRTSIGGLATLIIPLLIASTIILNTMLGSVFERKKEIAVFNAVGLNPTHIGLFFLAESFVYAIIGSVGGYLIGQVLSILFNTLGWIEDINLNFSSLSVAYVIAFTVSIVLLSTLYPASVATKAAVPSGKRKWSMPTHDGQRMTVAFPFIYQPAQAVGVMQYLDEYLGQFTEASTSDLIADRTAVERGRDGKGRPAYRLGYTVALAPFDLGVTQEAAFDAAFDDTVGAYRVVMSLTRLSGQDSNWVTTNKPFLERLRKFLLHWRNRKPAEHALHGQRGRQLFGEDGDGS